MKRLAQAAVISVALGVSSGVHAQILDADSELRAKQAEQFQAMFEEPENLELMFNYALTSIELKDFEAAISTLDRILIFNPNLPRVRLELAASYFRIGSYPVARHYFVDVIEDPDAPQVVKDRAQEFLDVIDQRTRQNYVTGVISANSIFTTNANNGPAGREIVFRDLLVELTGDDVTAQTDVGFSLGAQFTHVYDLDGVNEDSWRTNVALYSQRFASTESGAADVIVLRTGPQLSVDQDRYGLKARPFAEFDHVRSSNDALYTSLGGGFELSNTINSALTINGQMRLVYRDYHTDPGLDGFNLKASASARYLLDEALTLRTRVLAEYDGADDPTERSYEFGAEGSLLYRYDSGFELASRRWLAMATARAMYRVFDAPGTDQSALSTTRQDVDLRLALSNTAYVADGWAVVTKADYFLRDSNIRNFDLDSLTFTIGAQFAF